MSMPTGRQPRAASRAVDQVMSAPTSSSRPPYPGRAAPTDVVEHVGEHDDVAGSIRSPGERRAVAVRQRGRRRPTARDPPAATPERSRSPAAMARPPSRARPSRSLVIAAASSAARTCGMPSRTSTCAPHAPQVSAVARGEGARAAGEAAEDAGDVGQHRVDREPDVHPTSSRQLVGALPEHEPEGEAGVQRRGVLEPRECRHLLQLVLRLAGRRSPSSRCPCRR